MLLKLYQITTSLIGLFIDIYLSKRKRRGKEDPARFKERLGRAALTRPAGKLIWVHAASVGETLSVIPLIQHLAKDYNSAHILVTTGTVTSANLVASRLPDNAFHQYVPIDRIGAVRRFLKHWRPNFAIWVESELWPNLVTETAKHCQMVLINGRMSDRSYQKWKFYRSLGEQILQSFTQIMPQSQLDLKRFKDIGAQNLNYVGNLKFSAPPLPSDPKKMGDLVNHIGERPVWMAASTHPGEEEIIASIHCELKEDHPNLLTIIVPRHPDRAEDICTACEKYEVTIAQRSLGQMISDDTDIYLADTMGELGIFYRLVPIVFIGGTLVPHGGQNPLEAARLECTIIWGPYMNNFTEIEETFESFDAVIKVKHKKGLKHALEQLIIDPEKQETFAENAQNAVEKYADVIDLTLKELHPYLHANIDTLEKPIT